MCRLGGGKQISAVGQKKTQRHRRATHIQGTQTKKTRNKGHHSQAVEMCFFFAYGFNRLIIAVMRRIG